MAREQEQFLNVVDRDTAERLWWAAIAPRVLAGEPVPLAETLGRVLAEDVVAEVDVPGFDRSNVDGFAVRAAETFGAAEEAPARFALNSEELATAVVARVTVEPGTATSIATGGMLPRGADAVAMVESCQVEGETLLVYRPLAPGAGVSFAGTDMARGETVLRRGLRLSSRETGILAAIGRATVVVVRRPRVAILSTGDELIEPGTPMRPAAVHDANSTLLADAVRELGGEPVRLGIVADQEELLGAALERALDCDLVVLSGGTSKGAGDLSYRVLARRVPGIIVHGVALKPGKPVCLGAVATTPVAILPGFPTSAVFTFHEFVAPVIRRMGGLRPDDSETLYARLPYRLNSERGRTEYVLVRLVQGPAGLVAYPMGKGSGSVTTFSLADGFLVVPQHQEYLESGEAVSITPVARGIRPADLVVIGSHCLGLDALMSWLSEERGLIAKTLWVGSQGGLDAAARGECDLAGIHLLDPASGRYNEPLLPAGVRLLRGYGRMQGLVYRAGDPRFEGHALHAAIECALEDPACVMVNRNRGSGTRVLIDGLLAGRKLRGFAVEVRSHHGVASAVARGRADWGVAIAPVAALYGLGFTPLCRECFDFAIPADRWDRPAVAAFRELLARPEIRARLARLGFQA
ncbi:MAG TPA: molybdopterin biosynthesis protein [Isosphaeraceae bacterium]|nr:molybdopterin biosynthesis protein [Isosphaeraceae bacterium]